MYTTIVIPGIIFDLNGAVIESKGLYQKEEGKLFYKYGINVEEENRKLFRGFREEKFYRMSMKRYHIQESFNILNKKGRKYLIQDFNKFITMF